MKKNNFNMNEIIIIRIYNDNLEIDGEGEIIKILLKMKTSINILNTISKYKYRLVNVFIDKNNKEVYVFQKEKLLNKYILNKKNQLYDYI